MARPLVLALAAASMLGAGAAHAGDINWTIGINLPEFDTVITNAPRQVYAQPVYEVQPVVVAPRPVYVPQPVYMPAPVYVAPPQVVYRPVPRAYYGPQTIAYVRTMPGLVGPHWVPPGHRWDHRRDRREDRRDDRRDRRDEYGDYYKR